MQNSQPNQKALQKQLFDSPQNSHSSKSLTHSIKSQNSQSNKKDNHQQKQKQVKGNHDNQENKQQYNKNIKKRYKYCCRKCKHTEKGKKSCVCVVPLTQRRTQIGDQGCQTCSCKGCSIQDYIHRGQDPQYHPSQKYNQTRKNSHLQRKRSRSRQKRHQKNQKDKHRQRKFDSINGCCKNCMKAFSKSKKACLCQVPKNVRKGKLSPQGCKICGCDGCNPKDRNSSYSSSYYESESQYNSSSQSRKNYDQRQFNFNNIDRSNFGRVVIVEYGLYPGMLGLGIPQRTPSYILGKPQ